VLTALAYGLGLVMLPLLALVLLLQRLLFGMGGITALPVNTLAIGLLAAITARYLSCN